MPVNVCRNLDCNVWVPVFGSFNMHPDVDACNCTRGCTDTMRETAFIIYVILYLHYRFLCGIMCLCCCNANVLAFLYVFLS